jgi:hypothetical protein
VIDSVSRDSLRQLIRDVLAEKPAGR